MGRDGCRYIIIIRKRSKKIICFYFFIVILTLMSRCATFMECKQCNPSSICCISRATSDSDGTSSLSKTICNSPPGALEKDQKNKTLIKYQQDNKSNMVKLETPCGVTIRIHSHINKRPTLKYVLKKCYYKNITLTFRFNLNSLLIIIFIFK